jgi:hypothetical protein
MDPGYTDSRGASLGGGAVRRAADAARLSCEIIVTGVGGAAMSWALQKRFASGGLHGGHGMPRMAHGHGDRSVRIFTPGAAAGDRCRH